MKKCITCKLPKELSDFQKRKGAKDGHRNACKACRYVYTVKYKSEHKESIAQYQKEYRIENIESISDNKKEYYMRNQEYFRGLAREHHKKYKQTEMGKNSYKRHRIKWPNVYRSRQKVSNAIGSGKITRPLTCSECPSSTRIQGHHDDYGKPLDVRWLCQECHSAWHRHNTPLNRI